MILTALHDATVHCPLEVPPAEAASIQPKSDAAFAKRLCTISAIATRYQTTDQRKLWWKVLCTPLIRYKYILCMRKLLQRDL